MSAHAVGQITGKITCQNGEIVPLTTLQQAIALKLGRPFESRDQVVATMNEWEPKMSAYTPFHQVGEQMERIWDKKRKQKRGQKQAEQTLRPKQDVVDVAHVFA